MIIPRNLKTKQMKNIRLLSENIWSRKRKKRQNRKNQENKKRKMKEKKESADTETKNLDSNGMKTGEKRVAPTESNDSTEQSEEQKPKKKKLGKNHKKAKKNKMNMMMTPQNEEKSIQLEIKQE